MTIDDSFTKEDLLLYKSYLEELKDRHLYSADSLDHQMYLMESFAYNSFVQYFKLEGDEYNV